MSINILLRPYWQQGEKTLIHMLKRPLLWTEKDACSMRKSFTFRLHTNTPIRIKVAKIVSLNRPCCCWSPSHLKGHPSYCKRLINTQSYSQKQTPSALRPLDKKAKLLWDFVIARNVQTASPAEKGLTLDDPDFRNFVLDVLRRYSEAEEMVTRANIPEKERKRASKLISELSLAATKIQEWLQLQKDVQTVQQLLEDDQDQEMKELAHQELEEYKERLEAVGEEITQLVSPKDAHDDNDVIIELSAGVGGQEAMLFAADVFNMYERFASHMNWRFQVLEFDTTDLGGVRHATVSVTGHQAYKRFKFEAGVHRVQRIPKTEKAGRVHTSTMSVAVLPQPKQIDIKLESKDLKMETKKASGAGGQHVNTTDSAVRIVHLPTGIVAECQQERSQIKNKQIAMQLLQAKIYSRQLDQQMRAEQVLRKQQVGSSARSEKIRTYNFAQDRITDHRLGASVHGMEAFLSGGELLEEMTDRLVEQRMEEILRFEVEEFIRSGRQGNPL